MTHDDTDKPPRLAFKVTQARVQHYDDVVEMMLTSATEKYRSQFKKYPSPAQIQALRQDLVRKMVIQRDVDGAMKLGFTEEKQSQVLIEAR